MSTTQPGTRDTSDAKRIEVHHLTRVEGHGNIVVEMDAENAVNACRWEIPEAPRFFEAMLSGRPYTDIHHITSRICGICSIGHQLCSLQATEDAFDVTVSEQTVLLRKLALHAENLQSHILHIGYLVLPDLMGVGSVLPLATSHREELLNIIACRRVANEFSQCICGRTTHPQTLIPGGFTKPPTEEDLVELRDKLAESLDRLDDVVELFALVKGNYPQFDRPTEYVALSAGAEYPLYRGEVASSKDQRRPASQYMKVANEYLVRHSTAKWTKNVDASYMVGALARFNLNSNLLYPRAKRAAARLGMTAPVHNPFLITLAQLVECLHSVEESMDLIDRLLDRGVEGEAPVDVRPRAGKGTGAIEVPRGILFHSYEYDAQGRIVKADCVIPTNQNHANIQQDFDAIAPGLSGKEDNEIELTLSMLVRAYDPCISCSTHVIDLREPEQGRGVTILRP